MDENKSPKVNKIIQVLVLIGAIVRLLGSVIVFIALQLFTILCFFIKIFIKLLGAVAIFLIKLAHAFPKTSIRPVKYEDSEDGFDDEDFDEEVVDAEDEDIEDVGEEVVEDSEDESEDSEDNEVDEKVSEDEDAEKDKEHKFIKKQKFLDTFESIKQQEKKNKSSFAVSQADNSNSPTINLTGNGNKSPQWRKSL